MSAIPEIVKFAWPLFLLLGLLGLGLVGARRVDEEGTMATEWGDSGVIIAIVLALVVGIPLIIAVINSPELWGLIPGGEAYEMYGR